MKKQERRDSKKGPGDAERLFQEQRGWGAEWERAWKTWGDYLQAAVPRTIPEQDRQDIIQKAAERFIRYKPAVKEALQTIIWRILRNVSYDYWKEQKRDKTRLVSVKADIEDQADSSAVSIEQIASDLTTLTSLMRRHELKDRLLRIMAKALNDDEVELISDRTILETHWEAAVEKYKVSREALRKRLERALEKLRNAAIESGIDWSPR